MSYDPGVALDFFRAVGKPTKVARSTKIFAENEGSNVFRRSKIYLLLDGDVDLSAGKKPIGKVKKGEIFGELAAITHAPRTATATAAADCIVIALDDKEFAAALEKQPGFALMLMSMLIGRLRETIARLNAAGALTEAAQIEESAAFDPKRLSELVSGLSNDAPIFYQQGRQVMSEGSKAALMYAVVSGTVAVSIGGKVVERLGPGGAFGEAALVDQQPRLATAVAETDCELQPITRQAFLQLVKTSPQFGYGMLASLAERLRFLTERLK
ncbi:MAG TPA: cyclic nucleotide-binding domain-containing protein [Burkholderiales bacterium]|nr:cyclic nucleotide-binding domain-containing protein [Burkholderiales bacterium]